MNIGFGHALRGLAFLVRTQRNARLHGVITALVLALGVWLQINRLDWCLIALATASVWAAEAFNTAVERLADRVTTERDPLIKQAKDLAAGAVLLACAGAVGVGLLVLGPPLWARLGG
jgi:diacylglycerol kinase